MKYDSVCEYLSCSIWVLCTIIFGVQIIYWLLSVEPSIYIRTNQWTKASQPVLDPWQNSCRPAFPPDNSDTGSCPSIHRRAGNRKKDQAKQQLNKFVHDFKHYQFHHKKINKISMQPRKLFSYLIKQYSLQSLLLSY